MRIVFDGSFVNPKIENLTTNTWLQVLDTLTEGTILTLDTEAFTVIDESNTNRINSLIHSGDTSWLRLNAGLNNIKITCDSTPSGSITLKYFPAYF